MFKFLWKWMFLSLLFFFISPASFSEANKVQKAPVPKWVKDLPAPVPSSIQESEASKGIYYLLVDYQEDVVSQTFFKRSIKQILSETGVQNGSQISIDFDPSFQKLFIHHVHLWRDGKIHDRLDLTKMKVLQRETDLDRHIYDGRSSAVLWLEDVRAGDKLDYAFSIQGYNPIFAEKYFDSFFVQWGVPVGKLHHRILWPKDRQLYIKNHFMEHVDEVPHFEENRDPKTGLKEYMWEASNINGFISDGDLPLWYNPYPWIQLSEFPNWQSVIEWAKTLYDVPKDVPQELLNKTAEIKKHYSSPQQRLLAALKFVQEEVRYLGIEFGPNSHKPSSPQEVFKRRFGDCKDKTLLLTTLLRGMDIEAYPAFVSTDFRSTIKDWLPAPTAFNHVVVHARIEDRSYWIDPTRSLQGEKLENLFFPSYGKALSLEKDLSGLSDIPKTTVGDPRTYAIEEFKIKNYRDPATLTVTYQYQGYDAEYMRSYFQSKNSRIIGKDYLNFYAEMYPEIEVDTPLEVKDDLKNNRFETVERYKIKNLWEDIKEEKRIEIEFYPQNLRNKLKIPSTRIRTMPYALYYPQNYTQVTKVFLPEEWEIAEEETAIDEGPIFFGYHRTYQDKQLTLSYEFKTKTDHVEASQFIAYVKNIETIRSKLGYHVWYHYKEGNNPLEDEQVMKTPVKKMPMSQTRRSIYLFPWMMVCSWVIFFI